MAETGEAIVYIVDDDEPVRDSMKALLEACAYEVRDYASCHSFIERFDGTSRGCLVLDLHLPVMSGLEFLERFGAQLHGLPVIMVSGRSDPATVARAKDAGVTAFLEKPFEDEQLLDMVQRLLSPITASPA